MAHSTKVIGRTIWLMEEDDLFIKMVISTMGNGRMMQHMVMGFIYIMMGLDMKDNGSTTNNVVKVRKSGPIMHTMKEFIRTGKSMEWENLFGKVDQLILENLLTIISMESAIINHQTAVNIKVIGKTIKCTAKVRILGLMVVATKVSTLMIKNKVMVSIIGQMVVNIQEIGLMESSWLRCLQI